MFVTNYAIILIASANLVMCGVNRLSVTREGRQIPTGGGWLNCYYCNVYTSGGQSTGGGWGGYYPWNPGFGHPSQSQGNTLQNRCPVGQDYSQKLGRCVQIWGGIPPGTG